MKTLIIFFTLIIFVLSSSLLAQSPERISYQAVVRNSDDNLLRNTQIGIRISILRSTADGILVYEEEQTPVTNQNGLISIQIGEQTGFDTIKWSDGPYFIKTEIDPTGGKSYTISGTIQILSVPYSIHSGTTDKIVSLTTDKIIELTPSKGQIIYNITEDLFQVYNGTQWRAFSAPCWPQPTEADAGPDQTINDTTSTVRLAANTPESGHGTGVWITYGSGPYKIADIHDPNTTFTNNGIPCEVYNLHWMISTDCGTSSDGVNIIFSQTATEAEAGEDQIIKSTGTTTTLNATPPEPGHGAGKWSVVSGNNGTFDDETNPQTNFTGINLEKYTLRWTIKACDISYDDVIIQFAGGPEVSDYDGNTYNSVKIGAKIWMSGNLKTTHYADGTPVKLVSDEADWISLGNNNEDKAYCYYDNNIENLNKYGAIYTYAAAINGDNSNSNVQGICPDGWHLPTYDEWIGLKNAIAADGYSGQEGTALKSTTEWNDNNNGESGNGTDIYGFSAFPDGFRDNTQIGYTALGGLIRFWSATEYSDTDARSFTLSANDSTLITRETDKSFGLYVRCVKD